MPTLTPKRPRYASEAEIIERIDKKKQQAVTAEKESWVLDRRAEECLQESAKTKVRGESYALVKEAKDCREQAVKLRRKAELILDKHLPELKKKLAEFRTPQIPAVDNGDQSIPR